MKLFNNFKRHKTLIDLAYIFIFLIIFTIPLLVDDSILKINDMNGNIVNLVFIKHTLFESGMFPLWNNFVNQGIPITADPLNSAFNPLILIPFLLLPISIFIKFVYFASIATSGIIFYFILKNLNINRILTLLITFTYISNGYITSRIYAGHLEKILAVPLVTLVIFMLLLILKKGNYKFMLVLSLAITGLLISGAIYETLYTLIICISAAVYYFSFFIKSKNKEYLKKTAFIFISIIIALLLSAFKILPLIEISSYLSHSKTPLLGAQNIAGVIYSLFLPFVNFFKILGLSGYIDFPFFWWERISYVGLISLVCLILFLFIKKTRITNFIFYLLIITIIFTFLNNPLNPFNWLFTNIKFLEQFRIPTRIFIYTVPLILIITGFVLDYFYNKKRNLKIIIVFITMVNLLFVASFSTDKLYPESFIYKPAIHSFDKALNYISKDNASIYYIGQSKLFQNRAPIYETVNNNQRILNHNYGFKIKNDNNTNIWDSDYNDIKPKYFVLSKKEKPPASYNSYNLIKTFPELNIYKSDDYTQYAEIYKTEDNKLVSEPELNQNIRNIEVGINRIELTVFADNDNQKIILLESYTPNWKLYINGIENEISQNNYLNTTLIKGEHNYVFKFVPKSFTLGLIITTITILMLLFFIWKKIK